MTDLPPPPDPGSQPDPRQPRTLPISGQPLPPPPGIAAYASPHTPFPQTSFSETLDLTAGREGRRDLLELSSRLDRSSRPNRRVSPAAPWISGLILCGVLAGICFRWARIEHHDRVEQDIRLAVLGNQAALTAGQDADLGRLLADPTTQMIRLHPANGIGISRSLVAWNPSRKSGVLFRDNLAPAPDGQSYWLELSDTQTTQEARLTLQPGSSTYPFRLDTSINPTNTTLAVGPESRTERRVLEVQ